MTLRLPIASLVALSLLLAGCSGGRQASSGEPEAGGPGNATPPVASGPGASGTSPDLTKPDPNLPTSDPTASIMKDPPPTGTGGWTPSKADPKQIAKKVAKALQTMSGVTGEALAVMRTPEASGSVRSIFRVRDPKNYRVDYIVERERPTSGMIRADGTKRTIPEKDGLHTYTKFGARSPDARLGAKELVARWPSEFSRLMWRGLTDGTDPWVPVVEGLLRGEGGFKATFEERIRELNGKKLKNYRIRATRTPEAAKKLGPCELEMVFDDRFGLPVTIRVVRKDPKGRSWQTQWSAGYNFGQKLEASEFAIK